MKQKEVIWTILGALILSECLFGLTVDAEQNVKGQNLLIWEFAPYCKNGLEYVVLKNTGHAISLNGYSLSDGEGTILFGNVEIPAYSCLVIANNASAYYDYFGKMPDLETKNGNEITVKGLFKLANVNDEIYLYAPDNSLVDVVGYGEERVLDGWNGSLLKKPSQGTVYRRTSMKDTDTVQDWIATKVGRTSMHPARFSSVNVTAFVTPDCGLEPVLARIENATREILVASYTLDSPDIVYALENASKRNVTINVLFEGAPAGGLSAAEKSMLSKLSAFANLISYGVPEHTRYNYMHAKYMVIDGQWSVVSTENYKATSYTEQGLCGNRGWGAIVESPGFARQLATMFWQDVKNVYGDTSIPGMLPASYAARKELNLTLSNFTTKTSVANVTLLAAPDNALDYLLRTLAGVKESVVVEALDLPLYWEHRVNPFVEAFVNLSERGVSVRVLLDGSASNSKGNRETVGYLNSLNANISAKLIDAKGHGYRMLHTKGFVIDKAYVYLGSTNFCENSFDENREVGVFIESREIAEYFLEAFEFDWL
ncbi:MAG: phospholipase D-like domain-containing protein, partial [Thermoplasmata archaeon]